MGSPLWWKDFLEGSIFLVPFSVGQSIFYPGVCLCFSLIRGAWRGFFRGSISTLLLYILSLKYVFVPGSCRLEKKFFQPCPARNNSLFRAGGSPRM